MRSNTKTNPRAAAFSLIELLVVITIIAVLATLGLSLAGTMSKKAKATQCLSSLRQIGVAMRAFANDNEGRLPDTSHLRASDGSSRSWTVTLSSYLGAGFIGRCPANTKSRAAVTYAWSDLLVESTGEGIPSARCQTPSATLVLGESADSSIAEHLHFASARSRVTFTQFKSSIGVERHGNGANYLFVDGHIETLAPTEVKRRLDAPNTTFLKP